MAATIETQGDALQGLCYLLSNSLYLGWHSLYGPFSCFHLALDLLLKSTLLAPALPCGRACICHPCLYTFLSVLCLSPSFASFLRCRVCRPNPNPYHCASFPGSSSTKGDSDHHPSTQVSPSVYPEAHIMSAPEYGRSQHKGAMHRVVQAADWATIHGSMPAQ
jgi:hypothetical protein